MTVTGFTRSPEKARENPCGPSAPCFLSTQSFRTDVKTQP